jgi:hypothetical protein
MLYSYQIPYTLTHTLLFTIYYTPLHLLLHLYTYTPIQSMLTEVFFISTFDTHTLTARLLPILGLSFPETDPNNLLQTKLLVRWKVGDPNETPFQGN